MLNTKLDLTRVINCGKVLSTILFIRTSFRGRHEFFLSFFIVVTQTLKY